ncbi:MAG: DUF3228 family protein [Candidatus Marinimicrobia bacterium]|nr:DUF3228 family protein [Candidatus Neomarinimicrobiota bacterium]MDC0235018.1 DUF3228 family protein [Candidatus Neomarinimicrobiota bacterium]
MKKVAVNDFVRRQIKGSGKTYSDSLSFNAMAKDAEKQMGNGHYKEGYRDGVRIVTGSHSLTDQFICPFVKITVNTILVSSVVKRQIGEEAYIQTRAKSGNPLKAGCIEYILYRHDVLLENNEHTTNADWELISIHAIPEGLEKMPIGFTTMMRNQLELPGGTKAKYSSEEWAESVKFWQQFAALEN